MIFLMAPNQQLDMAFLNELHRYLTKNPNSILRKIKADFPQVTALDEKIDAFIAAGFILRENKRYQTEIPTYQPALFNEGQEKLQPLLKELAKDNYNLFELWEILKPTEPAIAIYLEQEVPELKTFIWQKNLLTTEKYQVTVFENLTPQTTLTRYFSGKVDTPLLKQIHEEIGDVVVDYYLNQTLGKLWRGKGKSLKEARKDIFTDSLHHFQLLNDDNEATVFFKEEITFHKEPVKVLQEEFQKEVAKYPAFYQALLRGFLLTELVGSKKAFTFVEKIKKERK